MEGGRKRQEAGATSGRRRAKAEQDPGAAERRRVRAEQDGAAERARAWEATLERRRVKAEQEAAAGSARAPVGGRRRQAREDPLARATTARDALEARETREAAADYSRMGAEREAVEERERVRAGRQRAIAEKKAKEEEARRKEEEIRQKEEEARIALQKLERETRELTRRLRQLEVMEKEAKEKLDKEKQEAGSGGGGGGGEFGPRRWPTREEFQDAMQKTQYDRNKFHIAIVGGTGSGKSSLINAFRNLRNKDPGAARAGMAGTTLEIGRYPEAGTASAGQCIVWYDFPGAGTQRDIPDHDLFVRQGLFVFDLVLLAIGDRFAEIDARIVEDCARFQIPVFIVWSKADMHILNLMKEYGDYVRAADNPALYAKCRDEFISQTQRVVSAGLAGCREKLPGHEVYVVSRDVLQRTYNGGGGGGGGGGDLHRVGAQHDAAVIHEGRLSRQLLAAAAGRRCDAGSGGGGRRGEEWDGEGLGTQALRVAADGSRGGPAAKRPVTNAGNRARNTAARGDAAGGLAAGNRNSHGVNARTDIPGPSNPPTAAAAVLHSNRQRNPPPPPPPVQPLQPPPLRPPRAQNRTANERKPKPAQQAAAPQKVLKMIYPRQPTDSDELFADLIRSNPDIEHMLVCKPRMFNPKAGMLTFSHLAPVPDEVTAFGATLRLKDYEARSRRGAGEKKGEAAAAAAEENDRRSNLPTCGDGGLESGWDS